MAIPRKILWITEGAILNKAKFPDLVELLRNNTIQEVESRLYWWCQSPDGNRFIDIDCYDTEEAVKEHLSHWANVAKDAGEVIRIEKFLMLGEVSAEIQALIADLNPIYMKYFGGFAKLKEHDRMSSNDIIWSMEGKINDHELFTQSMNTLASQIFEESNSLMHWCCVSKDGKQFFIMERFFDEQHALQHIPIWQEYGHLFLDSTTVEQFRVYRKLEGPLAEALAPMNPQYLDFIQGIAR